MHIFEMVWLGFVSVWLVGLGLYLPTANFRSFLVFKGIPVTLGLSAVFLWLNKMGFIVQVGN